MTNTPPSLRLFELLETMCARGQPFSLGDAIEATGWPKPSVHRMLGQLEGGGLLAREPDGRRYTPAPRLLRLAESGNPVQLTLCGERNALGFHTAPRSLVQRFQGLFRPMRWSNMLVQL